MRTGHNQVIARTCSLLKPEIYNADCRSEKNFIIFQVVTTIDKEQHPNLTLQSRSMIHRHTEIWK